MTSFLFFSCTLRFLWSFLACLSIQLVSDDFFGLGTIPRAVGADRVIRRENIAFLAAIANSWLRTGLVFSVLFAPLDFFAASLTDVNVGRAHNLVGQFGFRIVFEGILVLVRRGVTLLFLLFRGSSWWGRHGESSCSR